ncbi:HK97 family phage prohead protease [Acidiphilium sp. MT5]
MQASSASLDLAGDVVDQAGIDLSAFRSNPVILWQHNPDQPIARAIQVGLTGGNLTATIQFPPEQTTAQSDECWRLIQAGVISTVSIGFDPIKVEPLSGGKRGVKYLKSLLLEISFVSIPANGDAAVIARSRKTGARISGATAAQLAIVEDAARTAAEHATRAGDLAAALSNGEDFSDPDDSDWSGGNAGEDFSKAARNLAARILDPEAQIFEHEYEAMTPRQRQARAAALATAQPSEMEIDDGADWEKYMDPATRRAVFRRVSGW